MRIIRDRQVCEDDLRSLSDEEQLPAENEPVIVSLARFRAEREVLLGRSGRLGVKIPGDTDPFELASDLPKLAVVAIELPRFSDGRAFSTGRLLRDRLGYRGEIRATGWFLRDQIFYLWRCGFDAFQLPEGKDPERALAAFEEMSVVYQPAHDEALPLWRR